MEHSRSKSVATWAVLVGQNLELDVTRLLDELFHVEFTVAKGVGGFSGGCVVKIGQLVSVANDAHATAAAAGLGLEDDRIADLFRDTYGFFCGCNHAVRAGQNRNVRGLHGLTGFFLFAHEAR